MERKISGSVRGKIAFRLNNRIKLTNTGFKAFRHLVALQT